LAKSTRLQHDDDYNCVWQDCGFGGSGIVLGVAILHVNCASVIDGGRCCTVDDGLWTADEEHCASTTASSCLRSRILGISSSQSAWKLLRSVDAVNGVARGAQLGETVVVGEELCKGRERERENRRSISGSTGAGTPPSGSVEVLGKRGRKAAE
jgi:hypothetical protein